MTKRVTKENEACHGAMASRQLLQRLHHFHKGEYPLGVIKSPSTVAPRAMRSETIVLGMSVLGETAPDTRPQHSRSDSIDSYRRHNTKRNAK